MKMLSISVFALLAAHSSLAGTTSANLSCQVSEYPKGGSPVTYTLQNTQQEGDMPGTIEGVAPQFSATSKSFSNVTIAADALPFAIPRVEITLDANGASFEVASDPKNPTTISSSMSLDNGYLLITCQYAQK